MAGHLHDDGGTYGQTESFRAVRRNAFHRESVRGSRQRSLLRRVGQALGQHRRPPPRRDANGNLAPVSDYAKFCDAVNKHVLELIRELAPKYWFIENPRGGLRKMDFMANLPRYTVTYCQYGDTRMKPTDIWTNHPDPQFRPMCHNGDPCHVRAPRGAKTGTQGLKSSRERAIVRPRCASTSWTSARPGRLRATESRIGGILIY